VHQTACNIQPCDDRLIAEWQAVACHSHHLRAGQLDIDGANRTLVAWCCQNGIRAAGIGSPWTPLSAAHYRQYEGPDRDLYYSDDFEPRSVMDREDIQALFEELNRLARGDVLFYQDNETPKGRNGHCWWFGYHYDYPAWHDYSQDRPIQYYDGDPHCEINRRTGTPHRRRCTFEIFATQRRHGALGVWAHPTSWWLQDEEFVTNIAADCGMHLLADGTLDGLVNMGYDACHRSYQDLWFHFLDTGAVVPGFAENDGCHDTPRLLDNHTPFKTYLRLRGDVSVEGIVAAARSGASFSSTGAFATISVDGVPMGSVCETAEGRTHHLTIQAWPVPGQRCFSRLEIIGRGGTVLHSVARYAGGTLECVFPGSAEPSYIVVRGFGEHDDPDSPRQQDIRHAVLTNPVYLHPRGFGLLPARTDYTLEIGADSPWLGGRLAFEEADGAPLETLPVRPGAVRRELPASARVRLHSGGATRVFYIAMENQRLQSLLQYLWAGEFRRDHPGVTAGQVPSQSWRLSEMAESLGACRYRV